MSTDPSVGFTRRVHSTGLAPPPDSRKKMRKAGTFPPGRYRISVTMSGGRSSPSTPTPLIPRAADPAPPAGGVDDEPALPLLEEGRVEGRLGTCGDLPEHGVAVRARHGGDTGDDEPEQKPQHEQYDRQLDEREARATADPRS